MAETFNEILEKLKLNKRLKEEGKVTSILYPFKRFSKVHFFYEIIYNSFIIYLISNMRLSNCDIVPFTYLIIYLVLNFFGIFLYWLSSFSR